MNVFYESYLTSNLQNAAATLLGGSFQDPNYLRTTAEAAARRTLAPDVANVLKSINSSLPSCPARDRNLELLAKFGTVAVLTGQQTGLFGGPLLVFYKALSAIKVAQEISQNLSIPAVPVFWIQSEDHNLNEIKTAKFPGPAGESVTLTLSDTASIDRVSVKHRVLGEDISQLKRELDPLSRFPGGAELLRAIDKAYTPGTAITDAFRMLLAEVFAAEGLLFFDPRETAVTSLLAPVFAKALDNFEEISKALESRGRDLRATGFEEQVPVRPKSPLFFVHPEGMTGPRYRLDQSSKGWKLDGHSRELTNADLRSIINAADGRISSSALLRPLMQDSLFPTACYVGGPAEVSYFGQLQPLYKLFGLSAPVVVPRSSFTLLDEKTSEFLNSAKLKATDLQLKPEELYKRLAAVDAEGLTTPERLAEQAKQTFGSLISILDSAIGGIDQTLLGSKTKFEEKALQQLEGLLAKYTKAYATRGEISEKKILRAKTLLFPDGEPQERVYSWFYFAARYGTRFKEVVSSAISIFPQGSATNKELVLKDA